MVIDLVVTKTNDGYTAEVPSIRGCESWAHDEDTVIEKIIDLTAYYVKLSPKEIRLDRARKEENRIIYKLIFNK